MINLSLTDFIQITSKIGVSKANEAVRIRDRGAYRPAFDYYKDIREYIIRFHQEGNDKSQFLPVAQITSRIKRIDNFNSIRSQYLKFIGRKHIEWFVPGRSEWQANDVQIRVNPELGLIIDDIPYVIKLYFNSDGLTKTRVNISLFLMHQSLPSELNGKPIVYSILDIRQNKLISPESFPRNINNLLNAEAAYISSIWKV